MPTGNDNHTVCASNIPSSFPILPLLTYGQVNCTFHWEFYLDGQKKECMNTKTYSSIEIHLSHISSLKPKNLDLQRQEEMTKKPTYTFLATIQSSSLIILGSFTLNPEVPRGNKKISLGLRNLSFRSLRKLVNKCTPKW